jgi:Ran GTPase-activating protein (RanGAP) involved in mRNA processing and transport
MKGTNLNPTVVSRLRDNIAGPGGLHYLDLSNQNAGPKEIALIADCIKSNFQTVEGVAPLISVDFSGNHVCGVDFLMTGNPDNTGLQEFVNVLVTIGAKSRLKKIILSRNYIDLKGYTNLSHLINNGPQSLSELYLRDCGATDETIHKFVDGIRQSKYLQILDLSHNKIGKAGCEALSDALAVNSKLRQLVLTECDIGPAGAAALARGLTTNIAVETLFLGDNGIGDDGAAALATMLRSNNRIKHLDIQENGIGLRGATEISSALKMNRTLVFLGLQWNEISNDAALPLSEMLSTNNVLRSVHILGTQIDESGIKLMMDNAAQVGDSRKLDLDLAFAR